MAVGAGALSFFSPCSFPLLPGYVSFYLMRKKETSGGLNEQTMRAALPAGLAASAGILTIFLGLAVFGIFFSEAIREMVPVLIPITGAIILIMGIIMLADIDMSRITHPIKEKWRAVARKLRPIFVPPVEKVLSFVARKPIKFEENEDSELMGQYLYGLGYGAASAGCTAPVFIALLVASMSYTLFNTALIFLLYAITTAALMVTFTLLVAASQDTIVNKMRASTGMIKKIGGAVLLIVGLYLVYEYITVWA
jgi:cytochrome c-type biogenesis protein